MKNLIIVESPTKAKTISRFLGPQYRIVSSYGHVRDLPPKKLGINIKADFEPEYVIPPRSKKTVRFLKQSIKDAQELYLATDPDREGEAIAASILDLVKPKQAPKRIIFHEITSTAIKHALGKPREIDEKLVEAQKARRVLDRLVGYKLSPLLWRKVAQGLSAGRVQSVTVRLIVDREDEIRKFKSEEYWVIGAKLTPKDSKEEFKAYLIKINDQKLDKLSISSKKKAQEIFDDLNNAKFKVSKIEKKKFSRFPSPPFTTSTLQQEASYRLGFSAKKTMQIAQQLYEGVRIAGRERGLITYMRTDSVNLSQKALQEAGNYIRKNFGQEYALPYPRKYKTKSRVAQEAHEAIRPTDFVLKPSKISGDLTPDQFKLYQLIWRRAIASQAKEATLEKTEVEILAKKYTFSATGEKIIFPGFIKIYEISNGTKKLPKLSENEELNLVELLKEQKFTEPPKRYSEASLIKTLEVQDIGRPSTYAPTISTIQDRGYVTLKAKYFYPEEIGILVVNLLKKHFPEIVDLKFTARMEDELDEIASGKMAATQVLSEFYGPFEKLLAKKEKELKKKDIAEEKTNIKCEECGKYMVIKIGRYGKFLSCSDYPRCKFSKPLIDEKSKISDFDQDKSLGEATKEKCPKCGGDLVLKEGRFGPFLACSKYPKCKFTKTVIKKIGMKCPDCKDGDVIERRTKKGKLFWGCTNYPKCKWASWEYPRKNSQPKKAGQPMG